VLGLVISSVFMYFVIYRLVNDKAEASFKSVLLLALVPCLSVIILRVLLKLSGISSGLSLVLLLSALSFAIIYVFIKSKIKFKLSNVQAASVSIVFFFSVWLSEILHGVIMRLVFT